MNTHTGLMKNNNKNGKLLSKIKYPHKETCPDCGKNCLNHVSCAYHFVHENCWLSEWVKHPSWERNKANIKSQECKDWHGSCWLTVSLSLPLFWVQPKVRALWPDALSIQPEHTWVSLCLLIQGSGGGDLFPHELTRFSRSKNHQLRSISNMPLIPLKQQVSLNLQLLAHLLCAQTQSPKANVELKSRKTNSLFP